MNEILSDPRWQGAGVVLGAIIAFVIYRLQDKKKRLSYKVVYSQALFTIDKQIQNKLEILYNGSRVKQLNVFEVKIINDGRLPIKKEDFATPIELTINKTETFFEIKITEEFPQNLNVTTSFDGNKIFILPLLLNPKEFFKIRVMFDGQDATYNILARIEGVSKVSVETTKEELANKILSYGLLGIVITAFGGLILVFIFLLSYFFGWLLNKYANVPTPVSVFIFFILALLYIKKKFF